MRILWTLLVVAGLGLAPASVSRAQSDAPPSGPPETWSFESPKPAGLRNLMLLDPSRLTVTQSMSLSYGMGSAYESSAGSVAGAFINHAAYRVSNDLNVWVDVGVGFRPSMGAGQEGDARLMVPGFGLTYRPSEHFRLDVIVQNPSYYRYHPGSFWRR